MPEETIRDEFAVHMLNEDGKDRARAIALEFTRFLNSLESICGYPEHIGQSGPLPNAREMAIVRTKLQEANFFAKRAVAVMPFYQDGKL